MRSSSALNVSRSRSACSWVSVRMRSSSALESARSRSARLSRASSPASIRAQSSLRRWSARWSPHQHTQITPDNTRTATRTPSGPPKASHTWRNTVHMTTLAYHTPFRLPPTLRSIRRGSQPPAYPDIGRPRMDTRRHPPKFPRGIVVRSTIRLSQPWAKTGRPPKCMGARPPRERGQPHRCGASIVLVAHSPRQSQIGGPRRSLAGFTTRLA